MILLLSACEPDAGTVTMYGTVWDAPPGDADIAPNTTLTVYDDVASEEIDHAIAGDDGIFEVSVPAGLGFVLFVSGNDGKTVAFTATAAVYDFYSGDGLPWVATDSWVEATETTFADCGAGSGGMLVGEVRYPVWEVEDLQSWPLLGGASVTVTASDGEEHDACYLDDAGAADTTLSETSERAAFGVFGLPEGPALVDVSVSTGSGTLTEIYEAWIPTEGVVGLYPAAAPVE